MMILLPLLAGIIYLGSYLHDRTVMEQAALEIAMCGSLSPEEDRVSLMEERKQKILGEKLLGTRETSGDISVEKRKIKVALCGKFYIPKFVRPFFGKSVFEIKAESKVPFTEPRKTILRLKIMKS